MQSYSLKIRHREQEFFLLLQAIPQSGLQSLPSFPQILVLLKQLVINDFSLQHTRRVCHSLPCIILTHQRNDFYPATCKLPGGVSVIICGNICKLERIFLTSDSDGLFNENCFLGIKLLWNISYPKMRFFVFIFFFKSVGVLFREGPWRVIFFFFLLVAMLQLMQVFVLQNLLFFFFFF